MPGCAETVCSPGEFRAHPCSFKGKFQHKGKHYCKIHFPPNVEAKREAQRKGWDEEAKVREEAEKKRKKAFQTLENFITDAHHCSKCKTAAVEAHQAYLTLKGDD